MNPQESRLKLHLSIPVEALSDERGLAGAVTTNGQQGSGPGEVILDGDSDFASVMGLIRQAYEYQMDEG